MTITVTAVSHRGLVREHNEDCIAAGPWVAASSVVAPVQLVLPGPLFVAAVCDGLGGHIGGEIASRLAADVFARASGGPCTDPAAAAVRWINEANEAIYARMADAPDLSGMGSTVAGMCALGDEVVVFNVGDSRVYRWQDGFLCQVSTDDAIGDDEERVLSQCLGGYRARTDVLPHIQIEKWLPGRGYLLCSDGLYGALSLDAMEAALREPAEIAAARLLEGALAAGAPDNVSLLIVSRFASERR